MHETLETKLEFHVKVQGIRMWLIYNVPNPRDSFSWPFTWFTCYYHSYLLWKYHDFMKITRKWIFFYPIRYINSLDADSVECTSKEPHQAFLKNGMMSYEVPCSPAFPLVIPKDISFQDLASNIDFVSVQSFGC